MAFFTMLRTAASFPRASSSFAAAIQICGWVGFASTALLRTFWALAYVSRCARAIHISTLWGTHSTARLNRMRAVSGSSSSTAAFHNRTLLGMYSRALRYTRFRLATSSSRSAARSHTVTASGISFTARARIPLALEGGCKRDASSHTSAFRGHARHPRSIILRASASFPAISSSRAAATHPGACVGFVDVTDRSSRRAFLMSPISASLFTLIAFRSVM
mmetsp:Transcript_2990/g.8184  ORF Transcript_2990/g.8184 Transcript_2990/m.8184 type:complete len:219 (+) Transcript_2990:144-800(+)